MNYPKPLSDSVRASDENSANFGEKVLKKPQKNVKNKLTSTYARGNFVKVFNVACVFCNKAGPF